MSKVLQIESQAVDTAKEASMLERIVILAKEAGYTDVEDHWGAGGAHDSYTIDEAIARFSVIRPHVPTTPTMDIVDDVA